MRCKSQISTFWRKTSRKKLIFIQLIIYFNCLKSSCLFVCSLIGWLFLLLLFFVLLSHPSFTILLYAMTTICKHFQKTHIYLEKAIKLQDPESAPNFFPVFYKFNFSLISPSCLLNSPQALPLLVIYTFLEFYFIFSFFICLALLYKTCRLFYFSIVLENRASSPFFVRFQKSIINHRVDFE